MKNLRITRIASNPKEGSFSAWVLDGQPICVGIEPYTRDNAQNVSCIPAGQYICKRVNSPKYGSNVWGITNVQGRSNILIHLGNFDDDTLGCLIPGESFSVIQGKWAVGYSQRALDEFMRLTKDETELLLTITDNY